MTSAARFDSPARRLAGQADLAATCGHDPSTISRLEAGRGPPTDVDLLRRVATALEIPSHVLGALLDITPAHPAQ